MYMVASRNVWFEASYRKDEDEGGRLGKNNQAVTFSYQFLMWGALKF